MRSIRSRLLLLLVPATAVALLMAAAGIERAVRGDLESAFDRQVLLLAQGIGAALELEIDGTVEFDLKGGEMPELEEAASESFYAVADAEGSLLYASDPPPTGLFRGGRGSPSYFNTVVGEESMRLCLLEVFRGPERDEEDVREWLEGHPGRSLPDIEPQRFLVAAGRSNRGLRESRALLRRRLLAGFGLLFAVLVIFPTWAAGRSLRHLRRLSSQAAEVGPESPGARLDEGYADDEIRALVKALNSALDRLGKAYEQQKRFTADAAHELRSPLSAIRANCEVNLRKERSAEEMREMLASVHRTVLHLGAVVEKLLALSRLEGAGQALERTPLNLADTARGVIRVLTPLAEAREIGLISKLPERIPVTGDEHLLSECISNVLHNAIIYTPAKGEVTVEGGNDPCPWIRIADTGIGIADEDAAKIFERFYRADPSRSRGEGGSGLGLSIAQAIARLHGAVITVESRSGGGSFFRIEFEPPEGGRG